MNLEFYINLKIEQAHIQFNIAHVQNNFKHKKTNYSENEIYMGLLFAAYGLLILQ